MKDLDENVTASFCELDDDVLESVSGGVEIGQVVQCRSSQVQYCPGCGVLLQNYEATITGVRGVLEGRTVYWIKLNCCGRTTSVIETSIL